MNESASRALAYLNETYKSFDDLDGSADLGALVEQTRQRVEELDTKVRLDRWITAVNEVSYAPVAAQLAHSQSTVDAVIAQTRQKVTEQLHTAEELSLLRHSLADELSFLSGELVSSLSGPEEGPTLLEDLEALHRSLKELESVKGYVQVIEHALKLRYVSIRCLPWTYE